jgi:hypothetical protein
MPSHTTDWKRRPECCRVKGKRGEILMKIKKVACCIVSCIALSPLSFALTTSAWAEVFHLKAILTASAEVPPAASAGSGTGLFTYDTNTHQLTFTVVFGNLSGPATAAHIHGPAQPGSNAAVIFPFMTLMSPIRGTNTLTDSQAAALLTGEYYVNVHTDANRGGEIRGQILKDSPQTMWMP